MRRLIHRILPSFAPFRGEETSFRQPRFETHPRARSVDLDVFVPGVDSAGVELVVDDQELVITARKPHCVRTNWQAANFEAVQRDYQLRVPLDEGIDRHSVRAILRAGILKIHLRRSATRLPLELSVA